MANLIEATVYQIDGNPQSVATVVAFDTSKIRLQATTVSTIPQVTSFIEVEGEKLNAPVVKYFVSETVATLVSAANTGGTTLLQATVVAINENPFKVAKQMAFPANKVTVWSFSNGNIQSFLQLNEDKFYATEDKANLVGAANAGGGIIEGTNGLTIYDDTAVGLGGTLTQPDTIIEGDTRVWKTQSFGYNQGFNLNFDDKIYIFGIEQNEAQNRIYTRYDDTIIFTENYDDADEIFFNITHNTGAYEMNCTFLNQNLYNYSPLIILAGQTTTLNVRRYDEINDGTVTATFQMNFRRSLNNDDLYCVYNFANVPIFASNVTALAGGLLVGDIYRVTGVGTLNIVF
jgi:hypothetical protein